MCIIALRNAEELVIINYTSKTTGLFKRCNAPLSLKTKPACFACLIIYTLVTLAAYPRKSNRRPMPQPDYQVILACTLFRKEMPDCSPFFPARIAL